VVGVLESSGRLWQAQEEAEMALAEHLPGPSAGADDEEELGLALARVLGKRGKFTDAEERLVSLARGSRMRLLVNELVLSSDGGSLSVERDRLVLIDSLTLGDGVRTDLGWVGARLGFGFGLELMSMPRVGLPFMVHLYGGPTLTLANSRDFSNHVALQLDLDVATWTRVAHGDALFRMTGGLVLDAGFALGDAHRLRLRGRLAPGFDLGGGVLELSAVLKLELALIPSSGIFLVLTGSYRHGAPVRMPLDATLGIAF
jgi:hypothetical protein